MERKSTEGCGNRDLDSSGFDYKRFYLDVLAGYIYIYILDALRAFKSATSIRRPEDQTSAQIHCRLPDFGGCGPHFLAAEILYFAVPLSSLRGQRQRLALPQWGRPVAMGSTTRSAARCNSAS